MDGGDADRGGSLDIPAEPRAGTAMDQRGKPDFQVSISNRDAFSWLEAAANPRTGDPFLMPQGSRTESLCTEVAAVRTEARPQEELPNLVSGGDGGVGGKQRGTAVEQAALGQEGVPAAG